MTPVSTLDSICQDSSDIAVATSRSSTCRSASDRPDHPDERRLYQVGEAFLARYA